MMSIYAYTLLFLISFLSVVFMVRLHQIKQYKKYKYFRFYSYALVVWALITLLRSVIVEPFYIYHLSFLIYPVVFLITSFLYMTIKIYTGGTIGKFIKIFTLVFFIIDLGLSLTNSYHHLLLDINYTSSITTQMFSTAEVGIFFYVHTLTCYILMFVGLYELLKLFIINYKRDKDLYPFLLFFSSIIMALVLNIIHIFFHSFEIDPTFIFMVVVALIMLNIFKNRDLSLILYSNGNKDILDNSRELYIISNHQGIVVDCSKQIRKKYLDLAEEKLSLKELKKRMEEHSILYLSDKELTKDFESNKRYYHVKELKIKMPHFLYYGRLTLLYDETSDIKLINEMDRVMSHDLMTGLYNRNFFESQIPLLENEDFNFGVMIIDVDGLKLHNDYLGHKSGDELLINFSNMMLKVCNQYEELIPIRLGGDEFLFIAKHGDMDTLNKIASDLTALGIDDDPVKCINFSYGISLRNRSNGKFSTVLRDADKELYIMKEKKVHEKAVLEKYFKSIESSK